MREWAGDGEGADVLARLAADAGDSSVCTMLAQMRERAAHVEDEHVVYRPTAADIANFGTPRNAPRSENRGGPPVIRWVRPEADHTAPGIAPQASRSDLQ